MENCPKCQEPQFPMGQYVIILSVFLTVPINIGFIKLVLKIKGDIKNCFKCKFRAIQGISVSF